MLKKLASFYIDIFKKKYKIQQMSQPDGRGGVISRGKSEHRRTGCQLTASEGNFKESATENIPPNLFLTNGKVEKVSVRDHRAFDDRSRIVNPT